MHWCACTSCNNYFSTHLCCCVNSSHSVPCNHCNAVLTLRKTQMWQHKIVAKLQCFANKLLLSCTLDSQHECNLQMLHPERLFMTVSNYKFYKDTTTCAAAALSMCSYNAFSHAHRAVIYAVKSCPSLIPVGIAGHHMAGLPTAFSSCCSQSAVILILSTGLLVTHVHTGMQAASNGHRKLLIDI